MTTLDVKVLHNRPDAQERAYEGMQAPLIITEAPAGAAALLGLPLQGRTLTVVGDYVCLIPVAGLAASAMCRLNVTLTTLTASTSGPDLLVDFNPRVTDVAAAGVSVAGTGDGSVTSGTTQEASVTTNGAIYARYTLTLSGTPGSAVVNLAEVTGK